MGERNGQTGRTETHPPGQGPSQAPDKVDIFPRVRDWTKQTVEQAGANASDVAAADTGKRRVVVLTVADDATDHIHYAVGEDATDATGTEHPRLYPGKSVPLPTDKTVSVIRADAATSDVDVSVEIREAS
jgi:hypothetical protein